MDHHDAEMSDVVAVLEDEPGMAFEAAVAGLQSAGLLVSDADAVEGVVEGTIESGKIAALEKLPFVKYVRNVFSYTADFPPGDPRNLDGNDEPEPDVDDAGA